MQQIRAGFFGFSKGTDGNRDDLDLGERGQRHSWGIRADVQISEEKRQGGTRRWGRTCEASVGREEENVSLPRGVNLAWKPAGDVESQRIHLSSL